MPLLRLQGKQGRRLPPGGGGQQHPPPPRVPVTTYETVESLPMVVIKKDGSRQSFDRSKVLRGMIRACEKRPVSFDELERISEEIEQNLQNSLEREVSTEAIGEQVMDKLRSVDEVAYVRFASVYRQFKDIDTFMHELNKLLADKT